MVTVTDTDYAGWSDCVAIETDAVHVVCPTSVGPRVVHFGPDAERNCFHLADDAGTTPTDGEWHLFGGHRCWHAPEDGDRIGPDNDPVDVERHDDGVTLRRPVEEASDLAVSLTIRVDESDPTATVTNRIENRGAWPVEFAPWGITVLAGGGTAVLPYADRGDDRTADRSVALWPYTDASDDRIAFGEDAVTVTQDDAAEEATKVGVTGRDGWAAYLRDGLAFTKEWSYDPDGDYADRGAAAQVYTDDVMLELESLAPLRTVAPGEHVAHEETWHLSGSVTPESHTDDLATDPAPLAPE